MRESPVMHEVRTVAAVLPLNLHCGDENRVKQLRKERPKMHGHS